MSGPDIRVARTPDEVEAMRSAWDTSPVDNPAADPDHLLTLVRHSPTPLRPHVLLLEEDGRPPSFAGQVAIPSAR